MIKELIRNLKLNTTKSKLDGATLAYQALDEKYEEQVETISRQKDAIADLTAANDDLHAEIEKLRGELAETERKLNNAEWREKHFRAGNKTEPAAEAAKNKDGEYFERIDTDCLSDEQIKSVYEEYAHRVLDNGGYFPQDKDGNVWADAFILCLLMENGSQTFAAGSPDAYRSLLGGLFATARKDKDLSRALTLTKLWDMMFRVKEEPQKEGDGDA